MDIKILGSRCAISDYYLDMVKKLADDMKLDYTIVKIEDEALMAKYDVSIGCIYGCCPGCSSAHQGDDDMYTPALVINDELKLHSCSADEEKFKSALSEYI